jgi:hypothetical protein
MWGDSALVLNMPIVIPAFEPCLQIVNTATTALIIAVLVVWTFQLLLAGGRL